MHRICRASASLVVTSVLAIVPLLEAGAASFECSSYAMGDATHSGNGPWGNFGNSSASCGVNWNYRGEAHGNYPYDIEHLDLLATANGSIAGTLQNGQEYENGGYVLSGATATSAEADSHAVMSPSYFGIGIHVTGLMYNGTTVNLAANERYRYELDVTVTGTGTVSTELIDETFVGDGSAVEQTFHRSGVVDGATWATFTIGIVASSTATAPGSGMLEHYSIADADSASYRLVLTPVPIPAAFLLLGSAFAGLLPLARRRRHQRDGE
jgi:hypothetical protein